MCLFIVSLFFYLCCEYKVHWWGHVTSARQRRSNAKLNDVSKSVCGLSLVFLFMCRFLPFSSPSLSCQYTSTTQQDTAVLLFMVSHFLVPYFPSPLSHLVSTIYYTACHRLSASNQLGPSCFYNWLRALQSPLNKDDDKANNRSKTDLKSMPLRTVYTISC